MKKSILFFELEFIESEFKQLSFDDILSQSKTFKDKLLEFISQTENNPDNLVYIDRSNRVINQIEKISQEYIFGSFGKFNTIKEGNLTRGRSSEDFSLVTVKDFVEDYTYFYLDTLNLRLVILNNPKVKNFNKGFPNFLMNHLRLTALYDEIKLINLLSEKIGESLGGTSKVSRMKYSYKSDKLPQNEVLTINEVVGLDRGDIRTATVSISFETDSVVNNLKNKIFKFASDEYTEMQIETENETIDALEKIISKKVLIEISEEQLEDTEYVFNILKSYLSEN